jgi:hypothetical protein
MSPLWIRLLFGIAGAYDFLLSLAFLGYGPSLFEAAGVPPPNHWGYLQFAALLVMTFGLMFFAVAASPRANRNLIPYGILLKLSYTAVVAYYWAVSDVPTLFKPFAVIDAVMLVLFAVAYGELGRQRS